MKFLQWFCYILVCCIMLGGCPIRISAADAVDALRYITIGSEIAITDCPDDATHITIPDTILDLPVTTIAEEAFADCGSLVSVEIPDSVRVIEARAFADCTALTDITLPDSLLIIEDQAFQNCSALADIPFPSALVRLGHNAYAGTAWMDAQPEGVVYAGNYACDYRGTMPDQTVLTLRDGTIGIADAAFRSQKSLSALECPDSLTYIGTSALEYCSNLATITFPPKLKTIGSYAFQQTAWFYRQPAGIVYAGTVAYGYLGNMPNSTTITLKPGTTAIADRAFAYYTTIGAVELPDSLQHIGAFAFSDCTNLQTLTLPEGVQSIGAHAFYYCTALRSVQLPDSMRFIGDAAFFGCSKLAELSLPNGIESICIQAFANCTLLKSIRLPDALTHLGAGAFSGCIALTEFAASAAHAFVQTQDGVLFSADGKTLHCYPIAKSDTSYAVPDGVTQIADDAFTKSRYLEAVTLPDSLRILGNRAFAYCEYLRDIALPDGLLAMGSGAFSQCRMLTEITLPDGITAIHADTFRTCDALVTVHLPKQLRTLDMTAFTGCDAIASYEIAEDAPYFQTLEGTLLSEDGRVLYACPPNGTETVYVVPDTVEIIETMAFRNCGKLETLLLSDGLQAVSAEAFMGCSSMTNVHISGSNANYTTVNGVLYTKAGDCLVYYPAHKDETAFEVPDGVMRIAAAAFFNCENLQTLTLHDGLAVIEADALTGCRSLKTIRFLGSQSQWRSVQVEAKHEALDAVDYVGIGAYIVPIFVIAVLILLCMGAIGFLVFGMQKRKPETQKNRRPKA